MLLDAFGWRFVQRHADHPFLRRLEIEPVASQFPSTTTAHLTTLYTGLPVEEHGLYEWRSTSRRSSGPPAAVRDRRRHPLELDPRDRRARTDVLRAARRAVARCSRRRSAVDVQLGRVAGPTSLPFDDASRTRVGRLGTTPGLTYLYWDAIDAAGHRHGPSHPRVRARTRWRALDALARVPRHARWWSRPTTDRSTSAEIDHLDSTGRPCSSTCAIGPPGSARDCFLHVTDPETVVRRARRGARRAGGGAARGRALPGRRPAPAGPAGRRLRAPRARPAGVARSAHPVIPAAIPGSPRRPERPRSPRRGSASCRHERRRHLRRTRSRHRGRFVSLRRALGVTTFGINQIILRPGQRGRIHRHTTQEEVDLVLDGHAVDRPRGRGEGARAGESPASRPRSAATSPTAATRTSCWSRSAGRNRTRRPRRRGLRGLGGHESTVPAGHPAPARRARQP